MTYQSHEELQAAAYNDMVSSVRWAFLSGLLLGIGLTVLVWRCYAAWTGV